LGIRLGR